jgi:hypothetical protein
MPPLGRYEIRYAVVRDWYGPDRFGPFSSFSKADKVFAFRQDGLRITGFTIELILQVNGNLRTESIDAEDF